MWREHQKIDHAAVPKLPPFEGRRALARFSPILARPPENLARISEELAKVSEGSLGRVLIKSGSV